MNNLFGRIAISEKLIQWVNFHSATILVATILSLILSSLIPLVVVGIINFLLLIAISNGHWTVSSKFGRANTLTALRLVAIISLAFYGASLSNPAIAWIGLIILILDGVDGWLAKRFQETSPFGAYFDKETDAFFMLTLCLLAVTKNLIWDWVIFLGLFRYLFSLFLLVYQTDIKTERRSLLGRSIYVVVMISLLLTFLPYPNIHRPLIIFSSFLLLYSFGRDMVWILFKN
ncbi:MAG: hypothetical protein Kow0042_28810 [Calditrichia bacterium]